MSTYLLFECVLECASFCLIFHPTPFIRKFSDHEKLFQYDMNLNDEATSLDKNISAYS